MSTRPAIHPHIRAAIMARDGWACVWCHSNNELHLDHVIPYSRGGPDESWNLRVLCAAHNLGRGTSATVDDATSRAPVAVECTTCAPETDPEVWAYCATCDQYGDTAESCIDACPDGCPAREWARKGARRKVRARRRAARRAGARA